jgi:hypothetical protein
MGYVATELNSDLLGSELGEKRRSRIPARRFGRCDDLDGRSAARSDSTDASVWLGCSMSGMNEASANQQGNRRGLS